MLKRDEAYIGVLIDDLITKGTEEPYRMFTSRAEYRTLLRQDNADIRLTMKSFDIGLASQDRLKRVGNKIERTNKLVSFYKGQSVEPDIANPVLKAKHSSPIKQSNKLFKIFSRPKITMSDLYNFPPVEKYIKENNFDDDVIEQAEIQVKYSGYITKERNNANKLIRLEGLRIPKGFDYSKLKSMSAEAREKLASIRPETVAQASRISGVSPNDVSVLLVFMGR